MLKHLRGFIALVFVALNTLLMFMPIMLLALVRACSRSPGVRRNIARRLCGIIDLWADANTRMIGVLGITRLEVEVPDTLRPDQWYMVVSNHQTWGDIFVLQAALLRRVPALKFFMKHELVFIPLLGTAVWAMDFPLMHRYSRQYLARHPERKGQDLRQTMEKCAHFRETPTSIMNFLEGTRLTPEKHGRQASPFAHLLRPKTGGFALALRALDGRLRDLVDVTIDYGGPAPGFWGFLCGEAPRVRVHVAHREIPECWLHGDYERDPEFRAGFQRWVNTLWHEKDARLARARADAPDTATHARAA